MGGLKKLGSAIKTEAGAALDEIKKEGEKGVKWAKETGIPKAQEKLGKAADVVQAHGELTARRFGAEVREVFQDERAGEKAAGAQYDMSKDVFHRKVSRSSSMREFIASDHAKIEGFDNSKSEVKGIPVFPSAKQLTHLKDEFVPVRLYLTGSGIQARTYEQNPPEEHVSGKPQYKYKGERPATPDDLFQLQVTAEQVAGAIDAAKSSPGYKAFGAART